MSAAQEMITDADSVGKTALFILALMVLSFDEGLSFNVDLSSPIIFADPSIAAPIGNDKSSTFFGYSVGLYNYSADGSGRTWVLVGAPKGNRSDDQSSGVIEPGVVFQCSLFNAAQDGGCTEMKLDETGNTRFDTRGTTFFGEKKDNAWLGVSLDVQPSDDGRIVVCGHLWKQLFQKTSTAPGEEDSYGANGVCFWTFGKALSKPSDYSPAKLATLGGGSYQYVKSQRERFYRYGFALGQLGISAHLAKTAGNITNKNEQLLVGAPGVYDWRGSVARLMDAETSTLPPPALRSLYSIGWGFGFSSTLHHPSPSQSTNLFTDATVPLRVTGMKDASYFGYSVSSGFFTRDKSKVYYVAGAPHAKLAGKVFVFDYIKGSPWPDQHHSVIHGDLEGIQMGEFFGATVAVLDFNGDGLDDVVVGAPLHSIKPTLAVSGAGDLPDQGRVAVYRTSAHHDNTGFSLAKLPDDLLGSKSAGARFGSALSAIGDIDRDGYEDLAVGAPYEDDGAGAVHLFLGSSRGLGHSSDQRTVIKASRWSMQLGSPLRGFGTSLSRGVDMDGNGYPDLAIGSYASGHVVLLRTRPVARIRAHITTNPDRLEINTRHLGSDTVAVVSVCFEHAAHGGPDEQDIIVKLSADVRRHARRATLSTSKNVGGSTTTALFKTKLRKDTQECEKAQLKVLPGVRDFTSPITLQVDFALPAPGQNLRSSLPDSWFRDSTADPPLAPVFIGQSGVGTEVLQWTKARNFGEAGSHRKLASPNRTHFIHDRTSEDNRPGNTGRLEDFCKTCPILDPALPTSYTYDVRFVNGCGDDGCTTDLSVTAEWRNQSESFLTIGAQGEADLAIRITNKWAEPAYSPFIQIVLPEHVALSNPPPGCVSPTDSYVSDSGAVSSWNCDVPGYLAKGQMAELNLRLRSYTDDIRKHTVPASVVVTVSSKSQERNEKDNRVILSAGLKVEADLTVQGYSIPKIDMYTNRADREEDFKAEEKGSLNTFYMNFAVVKLNATPIDEVEAEFYFPTAFASYSDLPGAGRPRFLTIASSVSNKKLRCQSCFGGECVNLQAQDTRFPLKLDDSGITGINGTEESFSSRSKRSTPRADGSDGAVVAATAEALTDISRFLPNETFVANCSAAKILCTIVRCVVGPFRNFYSAETVPFRITLDMDKIEPHLHGKPNLEYQVEARVRFGAGLPEETKNALEQANNRTDKTTISVFLAPTIPNGVPFKWILLAIGGGIGIITLIVVGLVKAGFFRRKELEEIKEIKQQDAELKRRTLMLLEAPPPEAEPTYETLSDEGDP